MNRTLIFALALSVAFGIIIAQDPVTVGKFSSTKYCSPVIAVQKGGGTEGKYDPVCEKRDGPLKEKKREPTLKKPRDPPQNLA